LKTAKFTVTAEGKQSSSPAKEIVSGTEPGRGSLGTLYESFASPLASVVADPTFLPAMLNESVFRPKGLAVRLRLERRLDRDGIADGPDRAFRLHRGHPFQLCGFGRHGGEDLLRRCLFGRLPLRERERGKRGGEEKGVDLQSGT